LAKYKKLNASYTCGTIRVVISQVLATFSKFGSLLTKQTGHTVVLGYAGASSQICSNWLPSSSELGHGHCDQNF